MLVEEYLIKRRKLDHEETRETESTNQTKGKQDAQTKIKHKVTENR